MKHILNNISEEEKCHELNTNWALKPHFYGLLRGFKDVQ